MTNLTGAQQIELMEELVDLYYGHIEGSDAADLGKWSDLYAAACTILVAMKEEDIKGNK